MRATSLICIYPCENLSSDVFSRFCAAWSRFKGSPWAKTKKKNTNSTRNKSQTHRAKQYEVTSFLSTDCELSTETCSKNVYSLGPLPHNIAQPHSVTIFCFPPPITLAHSLVTPRSSSDDLRKTSLKVRFI